MVLCGISTAFAALSPCEGKVAHALLTRPPLEDTRRRLPARLACVRHAASVRPEPGSNSCVQSFILHLGFPRQSLNSLSESTVDFSFLFLSLSTLYRFQGPAPLMATVDSLTHRISFVNTFFRFLDTKISMIFDGNFSLLHCSEGSSLFRIPYAVAAFYIYKTNTMIDLTRMKAFTPAAETKGHSGRLWKPSWVIYPNDLVITQLTLGYLLSVIGEGCHLASLRR